MVRGPRKKILIFTIPNDGHLNILRRVIRDYSDSYSFGLVLVDQKNTPPDLGDLADLGVPTFTPRRTRGFVNTPASRVFVRVAELLDECLDLARRFDPDLVLYDFCALEGYFVGQILDIRSWSSIPGLVGPLTEHGYLVESLTGEANQRAIATIRDRYRIHFDPSDVELISNSLHIPGERNLLWSYPAVTPPDFLANRRPARYQFAGYLSDGHARPERASPTPTVYLSFGTEVMDNLWRAQTQTRDGVRTTVAGLARRWEPLGLDVVFATQGRTVLDRYPANWTVHDKVDQQQVLSRSDVFVTHGGSNSFHESLLSRVPMVVTPFFGDQPLIGRQVEQLGLGVALIDDGAIDTGKSKHFLNEELTGRIAGAVRHILADRRYNRSLHRVELEATPALAELD
jgi:UDP:flavonoid glycosyltransferase YjiC (YdhE family)